MQKPKAAERLTVEKMQKLKEYGYQYFLVKGYAPHRKLDHVELNHFTLIPVKELPEGQGEKGIFADIDSEILLEWARGTHGGIEAFIEGYASLVKT